MKASRGGSVSGDSVLMASSPPLLQSREEVRRKEGLASLLNALFP
jgi:hypothetical protein